MKPPFTHPGRLGAYRKGKLAAQQGLPREAPYRGNQYAKMMAAAWLQGYDEVKKP